MTPRANLRQSVSLRHLSADDMTHPATPARIRALGFSVQHFDYLVENWVIPRDLSLYDYFRELPKDLGPEHRRQVAEIRAKGGIPIAMVGMKNGKPIGVITDANPRLDLGEVWN